MPSYLLLQGGSNLLLQGSGALLLQGDATATDAPPQRVTIRSRGHRVTIRSRRMTIERARYATSAEDPDLEVWWEDHGELIDFTGYTFTVKVGRGGSSAALLTKTTGIVGAAGSGTAVSGTPNIVITWDTDELDLAPGIYDLELTPSLAGRDYDAETFELEIRAVMT